tara:strand:- start:73 stop:492 length:420 start_codon:yes stop_codon:yes gene_type:complete
MQIKIKTNAKEIAKRLNKKGKALSLSVKKALSITAQAGVNIILDRTKDGKGYKGNFEQYNSTYAAFRAGKGRGSVPDLSFTGKMLGSMTTKASSKQAEIFFRGATESGKAAGNDKKRPFFGFNNSEEEKLGRIFFRALK